ncbi:MAG: pilus assembly protein N-terminal domain-containing protein [Alphaproteobacteria bacterium]|nr:pilus assembly protein N-terminal domain-containing protein [Alphaproteobacteria bacterium]
MSFKTLGAAIAFCAALTPAALAEPFRLGIDQTVSMKLTRPANSVVVGNAAIADVTVHDSSTLLITGKAFGATNLLVLDGGGNTIFASELAVASNTASELTVVRAGGTYSYSCVDKCRATPAVGDVPGHFSETMTTITAKSAAAVGSAAQ